jgi:hypothetical protein
MGETLRLLDLFQRERYHKLILLVSVGAFLLLEFLIFLASASQAGDKSRILILDTSGNKVYESAGTTLSSYDKGFFEFYHGPIENYRLQVKTDSHPFPFRAWLTAAIGIPVGLILLVAFIVRSYLTLVYGEQKPDPEQPEATNPRKQRLGGFATAFRNVSVFHIGAVVLLAVLTLWMVPNFLGDFFKLSLASIREYKLFFLGAAIFLGLLLVWVIYLRYKLSKQMLENQLHLEKYRLDHQLLLRHDAPPLLPEAVPDIAATGQGSPACNPGCAPEHGAP